MTGKKPAGGSVWIDPDDAPELTEEYFDRAAIYHGATLIRPGRPPVEFPVARGLKLG